MTISRAGYQETHLWEKTCCNLIFQSLSVLISLSFKPPMFPISKDLEFHEHFNWQLGTACAN